MSKKITFASAYNKEYPPSNYSPDRTQFQSKLEKQAAIQRIREKGRHAHTSKKDNATLYNTNMNNPKFNDQFQSEFGGGKNKKTKKQKHKKTKTQKNKNKNTKTQKQNK
jgi:hypothetical protein